VFSLGKILLVLGAVLAGIGALLMVSGKIPFFGRLPGDITIKREGYQIYVPVTTSILLSVLLSAAVWLISFFNKK
jgi:hypothetical protein